MRSYAPLRRLPHRGGQLRVSGERYHVLGHAANEA